LEGIGEDGQTLGALDTRVGVDSWNMWLFVSSAYLRRSTHAADIGEASYIWSSSSLLCSRGPLIKGGAFRGPWHQKICPSDLKPGRRKPQGEDLRLGLDHVPDRVAFQAGGGIGCVTPAGWGGENLWECHTRISGSGSGQVGCTQR